MDELVADVVVYLVSNFGCIELTCVSKRFSLLLRQIQNLVPGPAPLKGPLPHPHLSPTAYWMSGTEKPTKRWLPAWRVGTDSHGRQVSEITRTDAQEVYALWFNGEIPEKLTVNIGGNVVEYNMFGRRLWDAHTIPTGDIIYYATKIILPKGHTFDDVEVFMRPYYGGDSWRDQKVYPARWYSDSQGTRMYNLLLSCQGMVMWKIGPGDDNSLGLSFARLVDLLSQNKSESKRNKRARRLAKLLEHDVIVQ